MDPAHKAQEVGEIEQLNAQNLDAFTLPEIILLLEWYLFRCIILIMMKKFSSEAKREAGHQLDKVQRGKEPLDWKPMQGITSGV